MVTQIHACPSLYSNAVMYLHGTYLYPLLTDFKGISTLFTITQHKAHAIYVVATPVLRD